ncbi:unnamed protein product [Acanthoscelides obtectus]|uniref:Uncharacterized protein n=1 Tax=Acanthoscelides obtectus TaxID=200917 RepID=A0A9P0M690_ACAOB|nr:unnamed protein product [Acanthoscelides obtectus]CAK1624172.1 hypothetical protein AOBTE_LOCUS2373 [Acanthoscelides obtectus]
MSSRSKSTKLVGKITNLPRKHKLTISDPEAKQQLRDDYDQYRQKAKAKGGRGVKRYNEATKRKLQNKQQL